MCHSSNHNKNLTQHLNQSPIDHDASFCKQQYLVTGSERPSHACTYAWSQCTRVLTIGVGDGPRHFFMQARGRQVDARCPALVWSSLQPVSTVMTCSILRMLQYSVTCLVGRSSEYARNISFLQHFRYKQRGYKDALAIAIPKQTSLMNGACLWRARRWVTRTTRLNNDD